MILGMPRSQPTYEELKRVYEDRENKEVIGSQPTYEELKLGKEKREEGKEAGSQPTYEELKRGKSAYILSVAIVLSLPMRN